MSRLFAGVMLATVVGLACAALLRPGSSYVYQDREAIMAGSSVQHWTGTDQLGRDRTTRVAAGLLLGLAGAIIASAFTTAIAVSLGSLAAFGPSAVRGVILLVADVFLTLPWLFLLMMVRAGMPLSTTPMQSAVLTFIILAALGWPASTRVIYQGSLPLRSSQWMIHGRASGLRPIQLVRLHVIPHLRPLILPQFMICIPAFIIAEANLGMLGLGVPEPLPSWGTMLLEISKSILLVSSAWIYLPIVVLVVVLLLLDLLLSEV